MKPLILTRPEARRAASGTLGAVLRKVKPQPEGNKRFIEGLAYVTIGMNPADDGRVWYFTDCIGPGKEFCTPYAPGDRVPCKERWMWVRQLKVRDGELGEREAWFESDGHKMSNPWRAAREMPLEAVRHHFAVSAVRPVRLGDVTNEQAWALGYQPWYQPAYVAGGEIYGPDGSPNSPADEMIDDYETAHGPGSFERAKGLWFWLIEGKVER